MFVLRRQLSGHYMKQMPATSALLEDELQNNSTVCTLLTIWLLHDPRGLVQLFSFPQHPANNQHLLTLTCGSVFMILT